VALLALGLLLPVVLVVGSQWISDGQYVPLFASLSPEDASAIVTQLQASRTPYRVGGNGDQILVPADKAAEIRLRMAVQGLPLGGGVGFEVFDKSPFGVSDFTQRLNYQRALQGELARTIGQLRHVARARVHLVLPQPSVFADRSQPASAAVFVKLVPGGQLGREEIRGIVHLVASSVEGLRPDRVTVVDTAGRVLSVGGDGDTEALSPRRLEIKAALEEGLERRLQNLLDAALGPGQAVARVVAQLNFDRIERTEERVDPTAVVRQRVRTVERSNGRSTMPAVPAGVPDPTSPPPGSSVTQNEGSRESENVTFELSRTVARTLTTPGELRRLSVAVVLRTPLGPRQDSDTQPARRAEPRAPEEIEKIRKVVMSAVGFSESRGDEVTVVEMPFDTTALDPERDLSEERRAPAAPARPWRSPVTVALAAVVALGLLATLWLLLRARSRRRARSQAMLSLELEGAMAGRDGSLDAARKGDATGPLRPPPPLVSDELQQISREREAIRQKAFALVSGDPDAAAQLLRAWLGKKRSLQSVRGAADAG
jgi:flagellar M-ring protein FliF